MGTGTALWSFVLVVGLLTVTPGIDTALILRTAALGRRRRAWGVVAGILTGTLVWGVLTSLGLTALLTASQLAYEVLRWAGVAYLVWLGGRMVWSTALIGLSRLLRGWLRRPAARRVLDRITGTVIVGLGLRLAMSE